MRHGETRRQIVAKADELFYQQGFSSTTFSDITKAVNISRGNLYHHFKAKDDILDAVIEARLSHIQNILQQWEEEGTTPKSRIERYIRSLLENWSLIKDYGCPVGTLCTELTKLQHPAKVDSVKVLTLFKQWLEEQFTLLNPEEEPAVLTMQMLSWGQGVAVVSNAFNDLQYVKHEVQKMCDWLQALPVKNT